MAPNQNMFVHQELGLNSKVQLLKKKWKTRSRGSMLHFADQPKVLNKVLCLRKSAPNESAFKQFTCLDFVGGLCLVFPKSFSSIRDHVGLEPDRNIMLGC